jgi:hypothetical protein
VLGKFLIRGGSEAQTIERRVQQLREEVSFGTRQDLARTVCWRSRKVIANTGHRPRGCTSYQDSVRDTLP